MKKTLIALITIAGSVMANEATLRYLIEFNGKDGSIKNAAVAPGETALTVNGYVNWGGPGSLMDGSASAHSFGRSNNWNIVSSTGLDNGNNGILNATDGFTITFNGYAGANNWGDFISFTVGNQSYKFEITDSTSLNIYNATQQSTPEAQITGISRNTWYNYGLSVMNGVATLVAVDTDGAVVSQTTFSGLSGNLTGIYACSSFEAHNKNDYYLDNVAVYDGAIDVNGLRAITREQVAGNGTLNVVPEPTTATLSLLALCGLAARRRRK